MWQNVQKSHNLNANGIDDLVCHSPQFTVGQICFKELRGSILIKSGASFSQAGFSRLQGSIITVAGPATLITTQDRGGAWPLGRCP